jgi:hypothetical protein
VKMRGTRDMKGIINASLVFMTVSGAVAIEAPVTPISESFSMLLVLIGFLGLAISSRTTL